jgi:serine/threonine protein kinase
MQELQPHINIRLGGKTDVWGIGLVAWSLIGNRYFKHGPVHCDEQPNQKTEYEKWDGYIPLAVAAGCNKFPHNRNSVLTGESEAAPATENYPQDLRDLVRRCLNYRLANRPTLKEIIDEADQAMQDDELWGEVMYKDSLSLKSPGSSEFRVGMDISGDKIRPT